MSQPELSSRRLQDFVSSQLHDADVGMTYTEVAVFALVLHDRFHDDRSCAGKSELAS